MAKATTPRLKIFAAQLGFYDTVVAAPSQAAALRAWGVHQNLFADGQARVTQDAQAIEAALADPGTPLKRAVGSTDPFALEAANLPAVPDAPKAKPAAKAAPKAEPKPAPKPAPDRKALDAAESVLGKVEQARKLEEADLRERQQALETERAAAQAAYVAARKIAGQAVAGARAAYNKAGGEA